MAVRAAFEGLVGRPVMGILHVHDPCILVICVAPHDYVPASTALGFRRLEWSGTALIEEATYAQRCPRIEAHPMWPTLLARLRLQHLQRLGPRRTCGTVLFCVMVPLPPLAGRLLHPGTSVLYAKDAWARQIEVDTQPRARHAHVDDVPSEVGCDVA